MSCSNKDIVRRIVEEIWNQGDIDLIDDLYSEDFVDHSIEHSSLFNVKNHREGFKELVRAARAGLTGFTATIEELIAETDRVAARVVASGVHSGLFMNIPATGKRVDLSDYHFFRIDNGRVREHWNQYNSLEIMQQLGVVPKAADAS